MVHVDAEPVRPDAAAPFAGLDPFRHFHHPARCRQHQTHDGVGDGFGQHRRGVHQQHVMRVERLDVEVVVADGNGRGRAQFGRLLQEGFVNFAAGTDDPFSLLQRPA